MRPPMSGTVSSLVEEGVGVITVAFRGRVVLWPSWVLPIMVKTVSSSLRSDWLWDLLVEGR